MDGYQRGIGALAQNQMAQPPYQGSVLGGEPMRMPELSREAERIEILIERLGQTCNELDARLTPVLRSQAPSPNPNKCQRDLSSSPFGCRLSAIADRFDGQLDFLRDLLNRLEV